MSTIREQRVPARTMASPSCGKSAAVALYLHGIVNLEVVARMFARHPEWAAA